MLKDLIKSNGTILKLKRCFFSVFVYFCGMKNIIITGTSRGIGFELALQFANAGHQVLALSRKIPQALLANENISCLSVDLSNED